MWKWFRWVLISIGGLGVIFFLMIFFSNYGHTKDTNYNNPPIFVTHDFIDLDKVDSITKFRSGMGHDYSGNGETCRSMRHYFGHMAKTQTIKNGDDKLKLYQGEPDPADAVEIYAPADGRIMGISGEKTPIGKQLNFKPNNGQGYVIRLDHIFPADGIYMLKRVKAGQLIGRIHDGQSIDMTVFYSYRGQPRLVSYFQVMTDEVFAEYQERGVKSRSDFIIPKEVVDANPWKCEGGQSDTPNFAEDYAATPEGEEMNYVHINGYTPNDQSENKKTDKEAIKSKD